ncbi:MAG: undecaprenyl/decaprenyl-phosphate alpha-N-acetylglucosaminyl 1-phosphate transferase [Acidimicrobiales bacterium]|nr:undecaprenyl/decaprenyl-phosphate alpha-N-acetylglucosaminyl 1-phosphate transferase [Acidimicrobiales bacterium]
MASYLLVFAVAFAVTVVLTPVVRRVAIRVGAVVAPDERRVHTRATATLGGGAMLAGFLVAMLVAWQSGRFDAVFEGSTQPLGVVIAAVIIFVVGVIDDFREVSAPAKIAGMVLAGSVLSVAGVTILFFRIPFADLVVLSPDLSALLTVLWVVGMANAVNLIDGLDGLAAGLVAIAAGTFFLYGERLGDVGVLEPGNIGPLLAIVTAGICLGFLPHNFHPAKIFMGDGGALLLGLLMAASTISVGGSSSEPFSGQVYFFFAPLFIPLFILGVPILDTLFAIIRRATKRAGVANADKEHLHHRLMRLGHGQRRSVLILWGWTLALSVFVLYPTYTGKGDALVPIGVVVLGFGLYVFFGAGFRRAAGLNPGGGPADGDLPPGAPPDAPADPVGGAAVEAEQDT